MNKSDHVVAIVVAVLVGIVLTITIGIFTWAYSHDQDVKRDEYLASHCSELKATTSNNYGTPGTTTYSCVKPN